MPIHKTKLNIGNTIYYIPRGIKIKWDVYILKGTINKINIFEHKISYNVVDLKLILNKTNKPVNYYNYLLFDEKVIDPENELLENPLIFTSKDLCQQYIKRRLKRGKTLSSI